MLYIQQCISIQPKYRIQQPIKRVFKPITKCRFGRKTEVEAYTDYLKSKYGNVSIQSIGKDQASLDRVGRGMSGSDVIIAPNILEQMATDSDKAAFMKIR